jgi:cytochrome c-type biogenesis protein CcmH/NrfG
MNPDRLAELEEERRFLLRSLDDLEREHDAGDVDDADYATLRDGYVARAASVLRAIDEGRAALPPRRPRRPLVVVAWVVGTLAVASVAGWAVARSSGQRLAGQTMTGAQPADEVSLQLAEARRLLGTDAGGAIAAYRRVLELDPRNAEALTYSAWLVVLDGRQRGSAEQVALGVDTLQRATALDPGYADPHCLLAVAAARFLAEPDLDLARREVDACLAADPPAEMAGLAQSLLDSLPAVPTSGG